MGTLPKRSKELEGKGGGHEVHHKTEELLRKTLNNPLLHSVPSYSLAGASSVLSTEEGFAKQGQGTERNGELIHRSFSLQSLQAYSHFPLSRFEVCQTQTSRAEPFELLSFTVIKLLRCPPCLLDADGIPSCFVEQEEPAETMVPSWEKTKSEHRELTVRDHFLI